MIVNALTLKHFQWSGFAKWGLVQLQSSLTVPHTYYDGAWCEKSQVRHYFLVLRRKVIGFDTGYKVDVLQFPKLMKVTPAADGQKG